MRKVSLFILLNIFMNLNLSAQKIDSDSLLVQTLHEMNSANNYLKAIQMAKKGIQIAPDYLDFHLALGRSYQLINENDSARVSFNYVINKNPSYRDAFEYLAELEIEEKNILNANTILDKALLHYPEEKDFHFLKLQAIELENDDEKLIAYLLSLIQKYPEDQNIKQQLTELQAKSVSDRVGVNYNHTTFERNGFGPWHLMGLQYVRERKKFTAIGRINYADRRALGASINTGIQYEMETYFVNSNKGYSFVNVGYSNAIVFPKVRFSYSYFRTLAKSWEGEMGIRYTKTGASDLYGGVLGIGKYLNSYWINFKSYINIDKSNLYPAFSGTVRYYFGTKYDYATILGGYGTSPDEKVTLGQLDQRAALDSYRIGAGYYKLFWEHYFGGIQAMYNHQEYTPGSFQNELDLFLSIHYKF
ncbi:YaiO family outer membrane beta-barrel protein [Flavobacterium sp. GT3R68]|uniref:YaiO family outer membrane beta-barrel protein n=1 Tax=Flavobacterium sp. GT3R68 TaxID=2594437 RepID=UPI000F88F4F5|nr:YaiO family outer membrane beta-barrel protein [Flavobacterium sp. GT3R68]RTY95245.1 YaiO family outer membrane beta-barrel protein [Flavobacterium sp. GSN2]TRW91014.1 YaiO family outer membrane beta-barrel protein [Flavobacterium sp. GT3R68]